MRCELLQARTAVWDARALVDAAFKLALSNCSALCLGLASYHALYTTLLGATSAPCVRARLAALPLRPDVFLRRSCWLAPACACQRGSRHARPQMHALRRLDVHSKVTRRQSVKEGRLAVMRAQGCEPALSTCVRFGRWSRSVFNRSHPEGLVPGRDRRAREFINLLNLEQRSGRLRAMTEYSVDRVRERPWKFLSTRHACHATTRLHARELTVCAGQACG